MVISVLIALSRLYLYVHYPSDVLCGMIIGVINGIIAINVINKFYHKM
ncbi:phosphatase PAP2 family protein [Clostridium butyricum]